MAQKKLYFGYEADYGIFEIEDTATYEQKIAKANAKAKEHLGVLEISNAFTVTVRDLSPTELEHIRLDALEKFNRKQKEFDEYSKKYLTHLRSLRKQLYSIDENFLKNTKHYNNYGNGDIDIVYNC